MAVVGRGEYSNETVSKRQTVCGLLLAGEGSCPTPAECQRLQQKQKKREREEYCRSSVEGGGLEQHDAH